MLSSRDFCVFLKVEMRKTAVLRQLFSFSVVHFHWTVSPWCLHLADGPRLRLLIAVSSFMPTVHYFHFKFVSFSLFFLMDLWRWSPLPEDPAREQKLCFIQSCVSLKQKDPYENLVRSAMILKPEFPCSSWFSLISFKAVVSINLKWEERRKEI